MKMYASAKKYFKEQPPAQKAISLAICTLYKRISEYEKQGVPFEKIFDDHVKYDKHGSCYIFKAQNTNMQLRILYAYLLVDGEPVILVLDYFIKKRNKKDYLTAFGWADKVDPYQEYTASKYVMRC